MSGGSLPMFYLPSSEKQPEGQAPNSLLHQVHGYCQEKHQQGFYYHVDIVAAKQFSRASFSSQAPLRGQVSDILQSAKGLSSRVTTSVGRHFEAEQPLCLWRMQWNIQIPLPLDSPLRDVLQVVPQPWEMSLRSSVDVPLVTTSQKLVEGTMGKGSNPPGTWVGMPSLAANPSVWREDERLVVEHFELVHALQDVDMSAYDDVDAEGCAWLASNVLRTVKCPKAHSRALAPQVPTHSTLLAFLDLSSTLQQPSRPAASAMLRRLVATFQSIRLLQPQAVIHWKWPSSEEARLLQVSPTALLLLSYIAACLCDIVSLHVHNVNSPAQQAAFQSVLSLVRQCRREGTWSCGSLLEHVIQQQALWMGDSASGGTSAKTTVSHGAAGSAYISGNTEVGQTFYGGLDTHAHPGKEREIGGKTPGKPGVGRNKSQLVVQITPTRNPAPTRQGASTPTPTTTTTPSSSLSQGDYLMRKKFGRMKSPGMESPGGMQSP